MGQGSFYAKFSKKVPGFLIDYLVHDKLVWVWGYVVGVTFPAYYMRGGFFLSCSRVFTICLVYVSYLIL